MDQRQGVTEQMTGLEVGEEIAGYRVIELVGTGGMGRVYRALHVPLDRVVAFKVIRPEIASDDGFQERFRREARLIASIDHPSVVPVYDADEIGGVLFIAMRWMGGSDLRRLVAGGPLEPGRAVHVLGDVAAAVDAAHRVGLVHRDIKPANVLLEGQRAFLSDFGLARLAAVAGPEASTITGGFVGTLDYAAPELFDGAPGTAQSDIYAIGCVLYEMLTGSVPHPIESMLAKARAHAHGERPVPSARQPDLPRGLDEVVVRALAIDPAARFATAGELTAAAERALRTSPARRPVSGRGRRRRQIGLIAAMLLGVTGIALGLIVALRSHSAAPFAAGGRPLPRPASLEKCADELTGSPRTCFSPNEGGGVLEIGGEGRPVPMSTMNVEVTGIGLASTLPIPFTGGEVIAPPGTHFVVIDLTVTNTTHAEQEFEPSETIAGRRTALWLVGAHGDTLSWQGSRGADYSVQDAAAATDIVGLYQAQLPPGQPIRGQLVFYYPNGELREAKLALLEVKELGERFNVVRSQALIRLHP